MPTSHLLFAYLILRLFIALYTGPSVKFNHRLFYFQQVIILWSIYSCSFPISCLGFVVVSYKKKNSLHVEIHCYSLKY